MPEGVRICQVGLSNQEATVLSVAVNLLLAFEVKAELVEGVVHDADIAVVDLDSETGQAYAARIGESKMPRLIRVTSREMPSVGSVINKPLRVAELKDELIELCSELTERRTDSASAPSDVSSVQALVNTLMAAVRDQAFGCLKTDHVEKAWINGRSREICTRDGRFSAMVSSLADENFTIERLDEAAFEKASKGLIVEKYVDVVWALTSMQGGDGLAPGLSPALRYKLKVWPKLSGRYLRPEYVALAALLTRRPHSLNDLLEASAISRPDATDFMNAVFAMGILEASDDAPTPKKGGVSEERKGLFAKIARRLSATKE